MSYARTKADIASCTHNKFLAIVLHTRWRRDAIGQRDLSSKRPVRQLNVIDIFNWRATTFEIDLFSEGEVASSTWGLNPFQRKVHDIKTTDSPEFSFRALFPGVIGSAEPANEQPFADVKLVCGVHAAATKPDLPSPSTTAESFDSTADGAPRIAEETCRYARRSVSKYDDEAAIKTDGSTSKQLAQRGDSAVERVFNCHRLVLAGKSPLFERMFACSSFSECVNSQVKITDILPDTMEDILRYIYCGYIETDMTEAADDVEEEFLYAATKYDLPGLIELLLLAIKEKLNANTVCRFWLIADHFDLKSLKVACLVVLTTHANRPLVIQSPDWADVSKRSDLMTELYSYEGEKARLEQAPPMSSEQQPLRRVASSSPDRGGCHDPNCSYCDSD